MQDYIGKHIDRYRITEHLGMGGMAVVFKAEDTLLNRHVALKIIRKEGIPPSQLARIMERFRREAQAMSAFSDVPGIITVHDCGEYEGSTYLILRYMPGGSLKEKLGDPIPYQKAASMILPVVTGLAHVHGSGIIHRDIKPSNILIDSKGSLALADFGIVKTQQNIEKTLTQTGMVVGTAAYMAPEQWHGKTVPQSDIYGLGVVYYEMLTGKRPFEAETGSDLFLKVMTEPIPDPGEIVEGLPLGVIKVIKEALARDVEARYPDIRAFEQALNKLADGIFANGERISIEDQKVENESKGKPINNHVLEDSGVVHRDDSIKHWKKSLSIIGIGLIILVMLITGGYAIGFNTERNPIGMSQTTETPVVVDLVLLKPSATHTSTATVTPTPTEKSTPTKTMTPTYTLTATMGIVATQKREIDGMVQVLVPAGEYQAGYTDEQAELIREICELKNDGNISGFHTQGGGFMEYCDPSWFSKREEIIYVDSFWIDKTEVTNEMYETCRLAGVCPGRGSRGSFNRQDYYRNIIYNNYPATFTYWFEAAAYCRWVGGRLPSAIEWEKAARGTDGRLYPWGDDPPSPSLLNYYGSGFDDTVEVGSYPEGMSPFGALDMLGNVAEWIEDCLEEIDVDDPGKHFDVLCGYKGGSVIDTFLFLDLIRTPYQPSGSSGGQGFRCLVDP